MEKQFFKQIEKKYNKRDIIAEYAQFGSKVSFFFSGSLSKDSDVRVLPIQSPLTQATKTKTIQDLNIPGRDEEETYKRLERMTQKKISLLQEREPLTVTQKAVRLLSLFTKTKELKRTTCPFFFFFCFNRKFF
jgi:hypothetical protein